MGDIIYIEEWYEAKANKLAQKFRRCVNTGHEHAVKCELRDLGERLAEYKMHSMRTKKEAGIKE